MTALNDTYTSTGHKFFAHQEAMQNLRNGKGQCITTHVMLTDICNHSCAFCSVQARAGDSLVFDNVMSYLDILMKYGLKSVILSGGGNPILYKCKVSGKNFNDVVDAIHGRGLEIGLITNGMPLRLFQPGTNFSIEIPHNFEQISQLAYLGRRSWKMVQPETLDKLTWIRISMAGLDHEEHKVYVPDVDSNKTALGFSYVAHDLYHEAADPYHGKVSRPLDILSGDRGRKPDLAFEDRINELTDEIASYVEGYKPRYVRLLPNCLEPSLITHRCGQLADMAEEVNSKVGREVVFVQHKPPKAPHACLLGSIHPVLNADGFCYPCDSVVLNEAAGHKFGETWRMCHWSEIGKLYENKLPHSLISNTLKQCPGCVFTRSNEILQGVRDGSIDPIPPVETPEHVNFV